MTGSGEQVLNCPHKPSVILKWVQRELNWGLHFTTIVGLQTSLTVTQ